MSSDPQDLLYTNEFISTDVLDDNTIENNTKFYDRYINYIDKKDEITTNNYLNTNLREDNKININNSLYEHWPINENKNKAPLEDSFIKDVSEDNYKFTRNRKIIVYSENRNKNQYPYSTNFTIQTGKTIDNIERIEFSDFDIPTLTPNISIYNNNFCWQYFSDYYSYNNISFNIVPMPDNSKLISYYTLPYSCTRIPENIAKINPTFNPESFLTYQVNLPPGDYTTTSIAYAINQISSLVDHGGKDYNVVPDDKINLVYNELNTENFYEEPYLSFKNLKNTPHRWKFIVERNQSTFYAVNRMEEIRISAIQTFAQPIEGKYSLETFSKIDPFFKYSNKKEVLDSKLFYIIVPLQRFITDLWFDNSGSDIYKTETYINPFIPNAFPLVMTDLISPTTFIDSKIGGLSKYYMSYTSYFDATIYEDNGIEDLSTINYYKYYDTLSIPVNEDENDNQIFFRLGFSYNQKLTRGRSFNNSINIPTSKNSVPSSDSTIIYNELLFTKLKSLNANITISQGGGDLGSEPLIGRALLCRFMYDNVNGKYTTYESQNTYIGKSSILSNLGMPIANQTAALFVSNYNYGFAFIHTTKNYLILNGQDPYSLTTIIPDTYQLYPPKGIMRTVNGYIVNDPFYYLRILFVDLDESTSTQDQLIVAEDRYNLTIEQNYITNPSFSITPLGYSVECLNDKSRNIISIGRNSIFLKLSISGGEIIGSGNVSNTPSKYSTTFTCYDKPIDKFANIKVEILDSKLRQIQSSASISFIMNVITKDKKLKNTEINTKNNSIAANALFTGGFS